MRVIPTKIHGLLDYVVAVILILAPWLFGYAGPNSATYVPVALGFTTLGYSIVTNYEWGAVKIIPVYVHLRLDLLSGVLLALSPWLFGFGKYIYVPHLLLGLLEILASLMTNPITYESDLEKLMKKRERFLRRHFL